MWQRPIIVLILLATQAAAGTATSFQLSISGRGRALAQDGSVVGNPFANSSTFEDVATCQSLQDVLEITNRTHNSTHEPTQQEVQECVDNSHLSIADGRQLLFAIREDRPLVKVMQSSGPIIALPSRIPPSIGEFFKNDSVAVLDCQGNWIDVRKLKVIYIYAVTIYLRCKIMLAEEAQGVTGHTWFFSSSTHLPCDVRILSFSVCFLCLFCWDPYYRS